MRKDFDKLSEQIDELSSEVKELKTLVAALTKQISAVCTVKIEEDGKQSTESYGNLILDEIITLKNKLEGMAATGTLSSGGDTSDGEISLSDLKSELLKLADMLSM